MTDRERAIRYAKVSRRSHVEALAWLDRGLSARSPQRRQATRRAAYGTGPQHRGFVVGSKQFHRQAIKEYDLILRVLRSAS